MTEINSDRGARSAGIDRIELMQTFVRIVEAGSLSAAATQLGTTQPTISRRLHALEQSLGLRLLQRTTHAMKLTMDGERCYERAKALLGDWEAFEADLRGAGVEAEGVLRVVVPHAFGQEKLLPPLAEFLRQHPRTAVEWLLFDNIHDYLAAGIDCAIHVGEVRDPGLVVIRLAEVPRIAAVHPSLLADGVIPQVPEEAAALPWLALRTYYRSEIEFHHVDTDEVRRIHIAPRVSTDNLYALRNAASLGLGACVGSTWLIEEMVAQDKLVQILPRWQAAPLPVSLVYPYARFYPARLRRFVELMREWVPGVVAGADRSA